MIVYYRTIFGDTRVVKVNKLNEIHEISILENRLHDEYVRKTSPVISKFIDLIEE